MNYKDEEIVKKFYELKKFKEEFQHDAISYLNVILLEKIFDKLTNLENIIMNKEEEKKTPVKK